MYISITFVKIFIMANNFSSPFINLIQADCTEHIALSKGDFIIYNYQS
jgi:hypothetical protein